MNSLTNFKGVISPIPTPFDKNENIYEQGFRNLLSYLKQSGIHGVFSLGSYGSFPLLELEERKYAMKIISDLCRELGLYNIMHIGAASTKTSLKLMEYAHEIEVDSIASISPFYYSGHSYRWEDIKLHHTEIVKNSKLPYCVYNNPRTTSFTLTSENLQELVDLGISGIKDSGNDIERFKQYYDVTKDYDFNCMPGSGSTMLDSFLIGARAIVAGTSVAFPVEVVNLYNGIISKKSIVDLIELQRIVTECRDRQQSKIMRPAAAYGILNENGIDIGYPKKPWPTN
jgi:dihydrodipicolinate synthase/N-acetylneuraminate lyase